MTPTAQSSPPSAAARPVAGVEGVASAGVRYGLALLFVVSCLNYLDRYILSILLEPIRLEFGLNDTQMGLLSGLAFALFYATLGLPLARLADRGNRRRLLAGALALWSAMTALGAAATGFWTLLLTRIGVGVGEAGAAPASHSLIADYYPPDRRGGALGVFTAGGTVGYLLAFIVGGVVAEAFGWRWALAAVGLPGVIVALLVWFTLPEPRDRRQGASTAAPASAGADLRRLWSDRAYRQLVYGATLWMFVGYGAVQWVSAYFMRVHDLSVGEVGLIYGLAGAAASLVGAIAGGVLADRFARRSPAALALVPAFACFLAYPLQLPVFLLSDVPVMMGAAFVAGVALSAALPAMYAAFHAILEDRLRAFGIAVLLFVGNLVGMGLGPLVLGVVSDALAPRFGDDALKFALIAIYAALVWAGVHFLIAARCMARPRAGQAQPAEEAHS